MLHRAITAHQFTGVLMPKLLKALTIAFFLSFSVPAFAAGKKPQFPPGGEEVFTSQLSSAQFVVFRLMNLWWDDMVPEGVPTETSGEIIEIGLIHRIEALVEELFLKQTSVGAEKIEAEALQITVALIEDSLIRYNFIDQKIYIDHYQFINSRITGALNERFAAQFGPAIVPEAAAVQAAPVDLTPEEKEIISIEGDAETVMASMEEKLPNIYFTTGQKLMIRLMDLWWKDLVPEGVPNAQSGHMPDQRLVSEVEGRIELLFGEFSQEPHEPRSSILLKTAITDIVETLIRYEFITPDIYAEHFDFIHSTITKTLRVRFPSKDSCLNLLPSKSIN